MSNKRIRRKRSAKTALGREAARRTFWPGNGKSYHDNLRLARRRHSRTGYTEA